jgi:hypothetical protein
MDAGYLGLTREMLYWSRLDTQPRVNAAGLNMEIS